MAGERILVVDDEMGVREALEGILRDEGFEVATAGTGEAGLEALERQDCDAVLLDVWLPGIDGLDTLQRLRERWSDVEVVMISGHGNVDTAVRATKLGAYDFIEKPLSLEKTLLVVRNALRHRRLELRNRHLLQQLSRETEILGGSPASERLRREVAAAAASLGPVLLLGEPGSGRETVARRIHNTGRFAGGPFVDVPCGALDPDGLDEALFRHDGSERLRLARGGTLFLEDVHCLGQAQQQRLAAVLAGSGGRAAFRAIASAGPEVPEVVAELQRALDGFRIRIPTLGDRRQDVPVLAERYMKDLAAEYGLEPRRFAPDALRALKSANWPGNLRQLRNLVERLLLLTGDAEIGRQDLPEELGGANLPDEDLYREFPSLRQGVEAFERYYIARTLAREPADRGAAARRLGLSLDELEAKLDR